MACSLALFNIVISIASLMAIELPPEIHFYQNVSNPFFKPAPISGTAKYLLLWADVRTAILEAHEEVCGETRLCTSKEDDKLSRSKCSVCETCFCDDMCQHYGDCCIDKIIDDHLLDEPVYLTDKVPGPLYSECMDVRVKAHRIDSNSEFSQHRLISKCPDKWPDPILRSECEDTGPINARVLRRDITLEQLSQNWPVASNRTSVFYKNRACASCHGDAEEGSLIFWKLKLSYEDFPELGPSAEPRVLLEAFLKDSSTEVSFTVPDGMDARPCQFVLVKHSDIIGKCNMTGFRYLYDPVLWKSCELFPTLFKVFGDYFANMFCYWCQYDDKMPASSTCYSGIPFPFFVILSPDAVQSIHDARQNFDCRCRDGFLYDPYKVSCRRLHCATGKTLRNGECLSSVDVGKGQYYSLSLTMTSRWPVEDMSDPVYPSNMETFLKITELLKSTVARTLFTKEQDVNLDTFFIHISQVTKKTKTL
ncbi:hypothetical protein RRG08_003607 [Elysia crispata]|uniref:SMB domain-containing protein n=1 Tax=Elysia crispata TaxID=231223 RepID=A0AAE1AUU8_9GAST|nr:hypothetical protein RRG08_003607 [Elysia crispata]